MVYIRKGGGVFLHDEFTAHAASRTLQPLLVHLKRQVLKFIHRDVHDVRVNAFRDALFSHFKRDVQHISVLHETRSRMMAHEQRLAHACSCHDDVQGLWRDAALGDGIEHLQVKRNLSLHPVVELMARLVVLKEIVSHIRVK